MVTARRLLVAKRPQQHGEREVCVRVIGNERQRCLVVKTRRRELAVFDERVAEVDARDRLSRMLDHRLGVERPRTVARARGVQDRSEVRERSEMRRVAFEDRNVGVVGRAHPPELFERDRMGEPRLDRAGVRRYARFERVETFVAAARTPAIRSAIV